MNPRQLQAKWFGKTGSPYASSRWTGVDVNGMEDSVNFLHDGGAYEILDGSDHLKWKHTDELASARHQIAQAISAYEDALLLAWVGEKNSVKEKILAFEDAEASALKQNIISTVPKILSSVLGNTWDVGSEGQLDHVKAWGDKNWEATPQDWVDGDGSRIERDIYKIAQALVGVSADEGKIDSPLKTTTTAHGFRSTVELSFPKSQEFIEANETLRLGESGNRFSMTVGFIADPPDRWDAEEARKEGYHIPKQIVYSVFVHMSPYRGA